LRIEVWSRSALLRPRLPSQRPVTAVMTRRRHPSQ
jgi:hypothetical protein